MSASPATPVAPSWLRIGLALRYTLWDAVALRWLGHRWPSGDEPSAPASVAALDRLCGDDHAARPRVLLVVSHADDEVAWAASRLSYLRDHVTIVYVSDGAPRSAAALTESGFASSEEYAAARREERDRALALMEITPAQVHELRCVDQQAKYHLAALGRQIGALLDSCAPDIVLTHAYEGGHVDHDSTAYAVHRAVDARRRAGSAAPVIIEFAAYHRRFGRQRMLRFLPARRCACRTVVLSPAMRQLKQRLFACFPTQARVLRYVPLSVERFRVAPRYDFRQPANWEHLPFQDQAVPGEPNRTLPLDAVDAADAELRGARE
jgi:LmbE family N-acetylglucosaminyl deacetylase